MINFGLVVVHRKPRRSRPQKAEPRVCRRCGSRFCTGGEDSDCPPAPKAQQDTLTGHEPGTIGAMRPGSAGYAVPWALYVSDSGSYWLDPGYTVHAMQGGIVQMFVRRLEGDSCEVNYPGSDVVHLSRRPGALHVLSLTASN